MNESELLIILEALTQKIGEWDIGTLNIPQQHIGLLNIVSAMHLSNFSIWKQEDIARRTDVEDAVIVQVKRKIDRLNQQRNNLIEEIDLSLLDMGYSKLSNLDLPMRTETPGGVMDRLSILALKVYHMNKQTVRSDVDENHRQACQEKLAVLLQQQSNLRKALMFMFDELNQGKIKFKVYRQYKMYNDPNLNPELYLNKQI